MIVGTFCSNCVFPVKVIIVWSQSSTCNNIQYDLVGDGVEKKVPISLQVE